MPNINGSATPYGILRLRRPTLQFTEPAPRPTWRVWLRFRLRPRGDPAPSGRRGPNRAAARRRRRACWTRKSRT
ncbi:hypothetical protein BW13_03875 [Bifidobacterium sp. UTCIF-37]|nr:hypothetical protein BW13_03875 [Bifidobacterium sp. UTCIF-37]TPF90269.1 hypothetical protein BW11_03870 [Bifidobacterium sp. UTCIF-38]